MTHRGRTLRLVCAVLLLATFILAFAGTHIFIPRPVLFSLSVPVIDAYDFVEITARVPPPHAVNPFTGALLKGIFTRRDGRERQVEGFCDAQDGSVFRVRFMPDAPGDYTYQVEYRQDLYRSVSRGTFHVRSGWRRGPIRIDPQHRWHFLWEGTGEHYFFNGTTAYWLLGWRDENVIRVSLERLHRLKVNRVRVTLSGRTSLFYGEAVMPGDAWTPYLTPWTISLTHRFLHLLGRAGQRTGVESSLFDSLVSPGGVQDIYHPGFDYESFDVAYWQKVERALRYARDRDLVISLVLDMNDSRVRPAAGSADERRFLRYAVARLAAFSNITWDLGDDLDQYRDDA